MVGKNINRMISVKIEVELATHEQIIKAFGRIDNDCSIQLCDGKAELKLISTEKSLAFDGGLTVELILAFSIGVASGVVANAFYAVICAAIKKEKQRGKKKEKTIIKILLI